jgi:hypothetical protein
MHVKWPLRPSRVGEETAWAHFFTCHQGSDWPTSLQTAYATEQVPHTILFKPECRSRIFLWNGGIHLQDYILWQPRRLQVKQLLLWAPWNQYVVIFLNILKLWHHRIRLSTRFSQSGMICYILNEHHLILSKCRNSYSGVHPAYYPIGTKYRKEWL